LRTVAIRIGTGTPYFASVRSAEERQSVTQPSRWSKTAQMSLMRLGGVAQPAREPSTPIAAIRLKSTPRMPRK